LGLKQILGLGSYQTAWLMMHKLRRAMVRPGRDRLSGIVEVDETYLGGLEEGVRGRQTEKKALIVVAAEKAGKKAIGRIRMKKVDDASSESLHPFVKDSVWLLWFGGSRIYSRSDFSSGAKSDGVFATCSSGCFAP
jgi:hypothetical protein